MLRPDGRAILLEHLTPPTGFRMEGAIATSFTLDLTATLIPAMAFSGFQVAGVGDPVALLEGIRQTSARIDIFCQAGAIGVPSQSPDLLAFLEPMVHPVAQPAGGLFHPKLWFVKYAEPETAEVVYRLLVLSRNLTLDSSWDLAVRLDSERVETSVIADSAALGDLLATLPERTVQPLADDRRQRVVQLADEARRIRWERPADVSELRLHYLGQGRSLDVDLRGRRHLVVAPFVNDAGINIVARGQRTGRRIEILSRAEELEKLSPETVARLDARVLDDMAVLQSTEGSRLGGILHAKMYIVEPESRKENDRLFIGSANATHAAFGINDEFLVEFVGRRRVLGIDAFLDQEGGFGALTRSYSPTGGAVAVPSEEEQRQLDNAIRAMAIIHHTVTVLEPVGRADTDRHYGVRLTAAKPYSLEASWAVAVETITLKGSAVKAEPGVALDAKLPRVPVEHITPFLAITVHASSGQRASSVVMATLVNEPDDRLDVILAKQIDSPDKFLRFLFLLLSLGNPALLATLDQSGPKGRGGSGVFGTGGSGVLEMVLRALADRPAALGDLDRLIERMSATDEGRKAMPTGFLDFWAVAKAAAAIVTEGSR